MKCFVLGAIQRPKIVLFKAWAILQRYNLFTKDKCQMDLLILSLSFFVVGKIFELFMEIVRCC